MFGKVNCRPDRLAGKAVIERKLVELVDGRLHKLRLGKAERGAPQSAHSLIERRAGFIMHKDTAALGDDVRSLVCQHRGIGVGVHMEGNVAARRRIARTVVRQIFLQIVWTHDDVTPQAGGSDVLAAIHMKLGPIYVTGAVITQEINGFGYLI